MREDFIVVHLYECCNFCRTYIHDGCVFKCVSSPASLLSPFLSPPFFSTATDPTLSRDVA